MSTPISQQSRIRRFLLERTEDVSGASGTGVIAEGVLLTGGKAIVHFLSPHAAVTLYDTMDSVITIHGHDGLTKVVWTDSEESVIPPKPKRKRKSDGKTTA